MPIPLPTYGNYGGNGDNDAWVWADRYADILGVPHPTRDPSNLDFVLEAASFFGRMPLDDFDWAYFLHDVGSIPGDMLNNILNHLQMAQNIWDALLSEVYQMDLYHLFYGPASALFMTLVGIPFEIAREAFEVISGFVDDAVGAFGGVIDQVGDFFSDFGNAVGDFFGGLGDFISDVMSGLGDLIGDFIDRVGDVLRDIGRAIGDMMDTIRPVVLDLDGDGVELISAADSDVTADGDRIGWVSGDDGILAFDADGDGLADLAEIDLTRLAEGAQTDLEGLAGLDSNHDGVIDASDEGYADLLVWRDLNGDGRCTADEVMTLAQAGVAAIALGLNGDRFTSEGNQISNTTEFVRADGTRGSAWDVGLTSVGEVVVQQLSGDVTITTAGDGFDLIEVASDQGATVQVSGGEAVGAFVRGGGGDDVLIMDLDGAVAIHAGAGADVAVGGSAGDLLSGGAGDDRLTGGAGADVLIGGSGADVFVFTAGSDSTVGSEDRILDFDPASDFIDLSGLDADAVSQGRQSLTWTEAFSGVAGQARLSWDGAAGQTRFELDRDGDGEVDFAFIIEGQATTEAGWIL